MKKSTYTILLSLILAAVLLAACGPKTPPTPAPTPTSAYVANGQQKFATTCVTCHGPDGKGMPNLGKDPHH